MTHKFMSMVNPNRAWKHRSSSKIRFVLLSLGLLGVVSFEVGRGVAQQPSTSIAPIFSTNAKYVNGVAPGYWPTAGAGLALNLSAGASYCGNPPVRVPYAAGTLTLTANATNYVYIDPGGLVPPGTPALSTATTGGTLAAGVYRVETTYLNPSGETLPSAEATITTTGTTSTITITAPAASGNAIGWNIYVTAVGGATGTETKQNATPAAIGTNFTLGSVSAGAALPAASTSNCAPTYNTSGFAVGQIPVATVVTGASSITAITDMRGTGFAPLPCAVDSMGGVQCSTASSNQDFVISPSGNGSLYVNSNITSSMTDARIRADAASSAGSARVSLFVPGVADWEMRTDEGNGNILRFGSGPGDGTISTEYLRFNAGVFLESNTANTTGIYIPGPNPTEGTLRVLPGSNLASSIEAYETLTNPFSLTNFSRIRLATGTSAGAPSGADALITDVGGTGTLRPIAVLVGATEVARFDTTGFFGVGTTVPSRKFDVHDTNTIVSNFQSSAASSFIDFQNTNAAADSGLRLYDVGGPDFMVGIKGSDSSFNIENRLAANWSTPQFKLASTGVVTISHSVVSGLNTVTFSATPTFDASLGNTQTITLTGNVTSSTLSNCAAGEFLVFDIIQDAAGSRTFVWPTNILNAGTIGGTASKHNIQTFYCDGANARATGAMLTNQN